MNSVFIGGVYECLPVNFKEEALCRIVNVLERTVVVEILEARTKEDKNRSLELFGRTVVYNADLLELVDKKDSLLEVNLGKKKSSIREKNKRGGAHMNAIPFIVISPKGSSVKKYESIYDFKKSNKGKIEKQNILLSIDTKEPVKIGAFKGYQFLALDTPEKEIQAIIKRNFDNNKANYRAVAVKYPEGKIKKFKSRSAAADHFGTYHNVISDLVSRETEIKIGKFKGYEFFAVKEN